MVSSPIIARDFCWRYLLATLIIRGCCLFVFDAYPLQILPDYVALHMAPIVGYGQNEISINIDGQNENILYLGVTLKFFVNSQDIPFD